MKKDFQEAVLSYRQDEFFRKNMYANFGDIGSAVKELVDEFQKQTSNTKRINTIEDMQVGSLDGRHHIAICFLHVSAYVDVRCVVSHVVTACCNTA